MDYNELAEAYSHGRTVSKLVIDELIEKSNLTGRSSVLEAGCGTASHVWTLAQASGCKAYGLDPSLKMMRYAHGSDLSLVTAKGEMIPYASDVFDVVFSKDVIHHMEDTGAYFREAFRVLVRGGRICTATDSEDHVKRRAPLSHYWPCTIEVDLNRYPKITRLAGEMERAGFSKTELSERELSFELRDLTAYRERSFSCLRLISEEEYRAGMLLLERDFERGPVYGLTLYTFLWGRKL